VTTVSFRRLWFSLTVLLLLFGGVAVELHGANVRIRYTWLQARRHVYLRDIASYYNLGYSVSDEQTVLSSRDGKRRLVFTHRKPMSSYNGVNFYLLYPTQAQGNQSFITEEDFRLTVDPLLRANALQAHPLRLILIDPGHGGKDLGGNTRSAREKEIVLATARRTAQLLRAKGYTVAMTRTGDADLSLKARTDLAARLGASLFISIHTNMASPAVSGLETFCMTPAGAASTHGGVKNEKEPGNTYDINNMALAFEIHRSILQRIKSVDRGVKRARFYVLRQVSCPAILIETGFLSNPAEGRRLQTVAHQQMVAEGIVEGVLRYHSALLRAAGK
jgi:N-acetylmuramoyl-L-alanine amidase